MAPAVGIIKPGNSAEVSIHHDETHTFEDFAEGGPQSWRPEDPRDKVVILSLVIRGSRSTETRSHQCEVRHRFSPKTTTTPEPSKAHGSKKHQAATHHRSFARHSDRGDEQHRSRHD